MTQMGACAHITQVLQGFRQPPSRHLLVFVSAIAGLSEAGSTGRVLHLHHTSHS